MDKTVKRQPARSPAVYLAAGVAAAIAGLATVYLTLAPEGNGPSTEPQAGAPAASGVGQGPLAGLNKGSLAAFVIKSPPETLPEFTLAGPSGEAKSLADFHGRVVLLNLWATWCAPCRQEMPELDKLQAELGGKDFQVVAVNIDRGGSDKAAKFLADTGAKDITLYTDPGGRLFAALRVVGMPTSVLLDRDGQEIGRLAGPAQWDSPEAKALIKAAIAADQPNGS